MNTRQHNAGYARSTGAIGRLPNEETTMNQELPSKTGAPFASAAPKPAIARHNWVPDTLASLWRHRNRMNETENQFFRTRASAEQRRREKPSTHDPHSATCEQNWFNARKAPISLVVSVLTSLHCLIAATSLAATLADLVPQNIAVNPNPATAGGTVTVSYRVANIGGTAAPGSHTRVQIKNTSYVTLTNQIFSTLGLGANSSVNESHSMSLAGAVAGTYYVYVIVDTLSEVVQSTTSNDGQNNPGTPFQVKSVAALADLVPQNVSVNPDPATAGGAVTISYTVANIGGTAAPASHTRVQIKNASYVTLTDQVFSTLGVGASLSVNESHSMSLAGAIAGTYYAYVIVDTLREVVQSTTSNDGQNNPGTPFQVKSVATLADLVPQSISVNPDPATAGGAVTISYTVANIGGTAAPASRTRVQIKNASYVTLTDQVFSTLGVGASLSVNESHSMSLAGAIAGTYYAYVIVDTLSEVVQSTTSNDGQNNPGTPFQVKSVATLADLVPQSISVNPDPATAGGAVTISYTVANIGGTAAPASHTRVQIKNASYVTLTDQVFSTLGVGASLSVNESHSMSLAGAIAGTYYAYVIVDTLREVVQSTTSNDGQNNPGTPFQVKSVATLADLVPQSISVNPDPATAGGAVTISYTVANIGGTAAPASHTRVQIKNASYVTLTDQVFSTLGVGASLSVNESHSMSLAGAIAGTYYAYVIVDTLSEVVQSTTSNDGQNNPGTPFQVKSVATLADLVPQSISVNPDPATAGGAVTISYTVANIGGTAAPASHTRVQIKNASYVTLTDQVFSTLGVGASLSVNESHSMSLAGAIAGTYYAYVIVDTLSEVVQSTTSNDGQNNPGTPFQVKSVATLADLVPQSVSVNPDPATAGGAVTISYTVANIGGTAAPASHTRVQIKNASYVTLTDQVFSTLGVGANLSVNESHSMSLAGAIAGTYYAYVIVDTLSEVVQSTTSNDGQNNPGTPFQVKSGTTPTVTLVSPNGGETWTAGTTELTQWSVTDTSSLISYFLVDYSPNSGVPGSWHNSIAYASSSARSASWAVPAGTSSTQSRIQVRALTSTGVLLTFGVSAANFTIAAPVGKPVAVPDASDLAPVSGESVSFTGANSVPSSPSFPIISYAWNFGDGQTATGVAASHIFPLSTSGTATYYVQLTVTDSNNQSDPKTLPITVTGKALGTAPQQAHSPDPVNLATGNYTYQHVDLRIPGKGFPFEFTRFYNSKAPASPFTPLGSSWTHSYNIYLSVNASNSVIVSFGDGHNETYAPNASGAFVAEPGVFNILTTNSDGTFTLTTKAQLKYHFNAQNRLASMVDKNGNTLALTYDSSGNMLSITDTAGRTIQFSYDSGYLRQITDPAGRSVWFKYDSSTGDLLRATDRNLRTTSFEYDSLHQLTSATDPLGNTFVSMVYDSQQRVVQVQKDALGNQTAFAYDPVNRITTVTDALGNETYYQHDPELRLVSTTDALENTERYEYDSNNNRTKVVDKNGFATLYTYDSLGNVTSKSDPSRNLTAIAYDSRNNPLTRTDALNGVVAYGYDANGNLIRTTNTVGALTVVNYDSAGLPLVLTDPNGNQMTNTFDVQGNLTRIQDALGNTTAYGFDAVGRKVAQTNANKRVTRYVYDNNDNLVSIVDPLGYTNSSIYDANNNRVVTIDALRAATTNAFDAKNRLVSVREALGDITTYEYDALDRKTKATDARGGVTSYGYDAVGNLVAVTNAVGSLTRYAYDGNGNQTNAVDPLGQVTTKLYDPQNRLVQTIDPLGHTNQTVYDALGRRSQTINALGRTTQFGYDAAGRLLQVTDPAGGIVSFTYDAAGNRVTTTNPNNQSTTNRFDALNRLVQTRQPGGGVYKYTYDGVGNRLSQTDPKGQTIQYSYDGDNRRIGIQYPTGTPVAFSYDGNGNLTNMINALGTTSYQFDPLNRLTSVTDPSGATVAYAYDASGNRVALTYPTGGTVTYGFDPINRMVSVTNWLNGVTTYTYDANGNLVAAVNPNGTKTGYAFDQANRLIGLTNTASDGSMICSYAYTLDAVGNQSQVNQTEPLQASPVVGQFSYSYDADNQMVSAEGRAQTFDAKGNMTTVGGTNQLSYDYENRLVQTVFAGITNNYQYDALGNRLSATRGGVAMRYVLDRQKALAQVLAERDSSGSVVAYYVYGVGLVARIDFGTNATFYHFDSRGSTVALTDSSGKVTAAYAYDPFGQLRDLSDTSGNPLRYLGRHGVLDEDNGLLYVRARYCSTRHGRFVTRDPTTGNDGDSQSLNRYLYALNNPVRLIDISGLSAQEANASNLPLATSDNVLLHNYLISPSSGGLDMRMAGTTPATQLQGGSAAPAWISFHGGADVPALGGDLSVTIDTQGVKTITATGGELLWTFSAYHTSTGDSGGCWSPGLELGVAKVNVSACVGTDGVTIGADGAIGVVTGGVSIPTEKVAGALFSGELWLGSSIANAYMSGITAAGNFIGGQAYNLTPGLFQPTP